MENVSLDPDEQIPVVTSVSDVPNVYADIMYHVTWLNGVARLAFVRNDADVPVPGTTGSAFRGKHVVSIGMPMTSVIAMRDYLSDIIAGWEKAAQEVAAGK